MKYFLIALFCFPMALIAQNVTVKDTLIKSQSHYLIKDGSKYLFSHEQWLKMTQDERVEIVSISDIQEALKRKGYYHGKIKNKWDKKSLKAFTNFQIDVGLPAFPHAKIDHFKALGLI